jgi:hypothetical protein
MLVPVGTAAAGGLYVGQPRKHYKVKSKEKKKIVNLNQNVGLVSRIIESKSKSKFGLGVNDHRKKCISKSKSIFLFSLYYYFWGCL